MNAQQWPLWLTVATFVVSAIIVWFAGFRLACYADAIVRITGWGQAALGMILLGGVTSLPELAVATTATLQGDPRLSINDVLGSAAINIVLLALADAVSGRRAITTLLPSPAVMLQGVLGITLLSIVAAAVMVGDRPILGIGGWSWLLLLGYLASVKLVASSGANQAWLPANGVSGSEPGPDLAKPDRDGGGSTARLAGRTLLAALAIMGAGFLLARTGGALAEHTGLGSSFFGAAILGFATSLPEVSTVVAAVRLGRHEMAAADLFGTNLFNVTILVLVDALHEGDPVLPAAGAFAGFAALLAAVLTALYVLGMLARREPTVLRLGLDSVAVVAAYVAGVVVLYGLR
jgi:cation:H+ antiporter